MFANVILIRWAGGWAERVDAASVALSGRHEELLEVGSASSLSEAYRQADAVLTDYARVRLQTDVRIRPRSAAEVPYFGFEKGDTVDLAAADHRALAFTVTEDDESGLADLVPTFNDDVVLTWEERAERRFLKMVPGTGGGRFAQAQPRVAVRIPRGRVPAEQAPGEIPHWSGFTPVAATTALGNKAFPLSSDEDTAGNFWIAYIMCHRTGGGDTLATAPTLSHADFSAPILATLIAQVDTDWAIYEATLPVTVNSSAASALTADIARDYGFVAFQLANVPNAPTAYVYDDATSADTSFVMDWAANLHLDAHEIWIQILMVEASVGPTGVGFTPVPDVTGTWQAIQGKAGTLTGVIANSPGIGEPGTNSPIDTGTMALPSSQKAYGYALRFQP